MCRRIARSLMCQQTAGRTWRRDPPSVAVDASVLRALSSSPGGCAVDRRGEGGLPLGSGAGCDQEHGRGRGCNGQGAGDFEAHSTSRTGAATQDAECASLLSGFLPCGDVSVCLSVSHLGGRAWPAAPWSEGPCWSAVCVAVCVPWTLALCLCLSLCLSAAIAVRVCVYVWGCAQAQSVSCLAGAAGCRQESRGVEVAAGWLCGRMTVARATAASPCGGMYRSAGPMCGTQPALSQPRRQQLPLPGDRCMHARVSDAGLRPQAPAQTPGARAAAAHVARVAQRARAGAPVAGEGGGRGEEGGRPPASLPRGCGSACMSCIAQRASAKNSGVGNADVLSRSTGGSTGGAGRWHVVQREREGLCVVGRRREGWVEAGERGGVMGWAGT